MDYLKGKIPINVGVNKAKYIEKHRRKIEDLFNVKLTVDVNQGIVTIEPKENTTIDEIIKAKSVIEAISYGFDIDTALELKNENYILDVIDLRDFIEKSKLSHYTRIKGRIIGEEGKAKKSIEELTGTRIVISDKVIAIIGEYENVKAAREAIEMLIQGRQHSTVYKWLKNWRREFKRRQIEQLLTGKSIFDSENLEFK